MYNSKEESKQILTRFGYRAIKELQKFEYAGDLLEFTTESGKKITSTVDHEHVVYNNERSRICITDGTTRKYIKPGENIPDGFTKIAPTPSGKIKDLIKKKAFEIEVGDYFTCRHRNPGERRLGKSYEEIYGSKKAKKIRQIYSEQRIGSTPWNKGATISEDTKNKISESVKGHYVSENCKKLSSERWQGLNNPIHNQEYWNKHHESSCITSKYELQLIEELNSLGLVINEDYIHQYCVGDKICDFYIKDKNLIIEIETNFIGCSYNDDNYKFKKNYVELIEKYNYIKSKGYNLLVYNPEDALDTYRKYINNCEKIVSINKIPFNGFVYDLEVNCDDICGDTTMYHTFYVNEILTGNCCRLRLDLRELRKKSGGYFGSGENTGSVGVVTINLPRISYLSNDEKDFYNRLDKMMDICAKSLKIKRNTVTELLKRGLYPYTKGI